MNKLYIFLVGLLVFSFHQKSFSQEIIVEEAPEVAPKIEKQDSNLVFVFVEDSPDFPGGNDSLHMFIQRNLVYPLDAIEKGIQGTVYLSFIVEKDGTLSNIKVIRGVSNSLDAEAIRVMKIMPKWKPGKQRGKAVRVQFNMPIRFHLQG